MEKIKVIGLNLYCAEKVGKSEDFPISFRTTLWIVFLFLPLVPLRAYRIVFHAVSLLDRSTSRTYTILEELPLNWGQVIKTWLISLLLLLVFAFLIVLFLPLIKANSWTVLILLALIVGLLLAAWRLYFEPRFRP